MQLYNLDCTCLNTSGQHSYLLALPKTTTMAANTDTEKRKRLEYYLERITALNLTPRQARDKYGLFPAPCGGILQRVKTYGGAQLTYLPEHNRSKYEQAQARRSDFVLHPEAYFEPYQIKRLHPEALRSNPGLPKYLSPKGATLHPIPGPKAIEAHRTGRTGGTVYFIEGVFKAVAMDRHGLEVTAFSGISVYRIKEEVRAYLEKRKPDRVVILYDADAKNLSTPAAGAPWTDRRPRDFVASAAGFARQFFSLQESINPEVRLYFAMAHPDSEHKGIDDILQHHPAAEVLAELEALPKRGRYIHAMRLHRTTYPAKLRKFFALDTYRTFYEAHRAQIGGQPFRYEKRLWNAQGIGNLLNNTTPQYILQADPYQVNQDGQRLHIKKYLAEVTTELDNALAENKRLALDSPPGSAKTTFYASLPKRTGARVVIACPTVNLAKQQAGKVRGAVCIHGKGSTRRSNKAAEAGLVFCTYDTLHQLPDLHRRIVVIDEAHNLINQFGETAITYNPFRADTLRKVLELAEQGQKAVFLSGTMPPLLAQALGAHLVQAHRQESNKVRVHVLEAPGASADKLTAATLAELHRIDWKADRLHFVFMNNTEQLEAIRAHLAEAGHLEAGQIELITRRTVGQGERRGFDSIVKKEALPDGVKLVLSTCLISEGVNINNRNIGRVLYTGNRCADTFRQYVARFRNVPALDVWAILPRENNLRERFLHSDVSKMLGRYQRTAALQVQFAEEELAEIRTTLAEEAEDPAQVLAYLDSIEAEKGTFESRLFDLIYIDRTGTPRPDVLRILATVREEKLSGINNAYFLQEITAAPNISLYSHAGPKESNPGTEAAKKALDTNGPKLVKALHLLFADTGDTDSRAELEKLAAEYLAAACEIEARAYLETHRPELEDPNAQRAFLEYFNLRSIGIVTEAVKGATAARLEAQRAILAETLEALKTDGPKLAKALHLYYTDTGNRKSRAELEELAEEHLAEVTEIEARAYLETHRAQMEDKAARRAIRDYCKLSYLQMTTEEITAELDNYDRHRIGNMWRQLQALATRHRYERKRERATMHHLHSLEAKADILIAKHLARAAEEDGGGGLTAAELADAIQAPLQRQRYDKVRAAMVTDRAAEISAQKAVLIAKTLFEVKEDIGGREMRYHLQTGLWEAHKWDEKAGQNVPKVCRIFQRITPNPAKIKALSLAGQCGT